jgi:uncharacterized repeat protein (TIGR02543 family)
VTGDATVTSTADITAGEHSVIISGTGTFNISGGTITSEKIAIQVSGTGTLNLNITGGTITATNRAISMEGYIACTVTISGGTLLATAPNGAAIHSSASGIVERIVNFVGGTITGGDPLSGGLTIYNSGINFMLNVLKSYGDAVIYLGGGISHPPMQSEVIVNGGTLGSGSGSFVKQVTIGVNTYNVAGAGTFVYVNAIAAPAGQRFSHWTASPGVQQLENAYAANTRFIMAGIVAEITANFVDIPPPTSEQFDFNLTAATYQRDMPRSVTVTSKDGVGVGAVTAVRYNGDTTAPTNAGTYQVTVDVNEGTNYRAATGVVIGDFTINKATAPQIGYPTGATAITRFQPLSASVISSGSSYPNPDIAYYGYFAWSSPDDILTVGTHDRGVRFHQINNNYASATITTQTIRLDVTVNRAPGSDLVVTSWPGTPNWVFYGTPLSEISLHQFFHLGTFEWTTPETIPDVGLSNHSVTFRPNDAARQDYDFAPGYTRTTPSDGGVQVEIVRATLAARHLSFDENAEVPYTGTGRTFGVTLATGLNNDNNPMVLYEGVSPTDYPRSQTPPIDIGTYNITVAIPLGTNFNETTIHFPLNINRTLTITKADPDVTFPTSATITYGETLADAILSGYDTKGLGVFAFTNGTIRPSVAQTGTGYQMTFTPTNTDIYNILTQNVNVTVNRATRAAMAVSRYVSVGNSNPNTYDGLPGLVTAYNSPVNQLSYAIASQSGPVTFAIDATTGRLTYTRQTGTVGQTAIAAVTVSGFANYNPITINVTVTITEKQIVNITGVTVTNRGWTGDPIEPSGTPVVRLDSDDSVVTPLLPLIFTYTDTDLVTGGVLAEAPTDVGTYSLVVSVDDDEANYAGTSEIIEFEITRGTQSPPTGLTHSNVSAFGGSNGQILGVTTEMEWRRSTTPTWTDGTGDPITGLVAGTYFVRFIETANLLEGSPATINITQPAQQFNLTVNAGTGGTVNISSGLRAAGTSVNALARANAGYNFTGWTISGATIAGGSNANPAVFTMPSNSVTLTANFAAVQPPTTEEPTIEEPTIEEPTSEEPTSEEPTIEEPTSEEPTIEEPTSEEPTTEESTTEAPTTQPPTQPSGGGGGGGQPTTQPPTQTPTQPPTTQTPTTEEPTIEAPTTEAPTTESPVPATISGSGGTNTNAGETINIPIAMNNNTGEVTIKLDTESQAILIADALEQAQSQGGNAQPVVTLDLSAIKDVTAAVLNVETAEIFAEAELAVTIVLPATEITLNPDALALLADVTDNGATPIIVEAAIIPMSELRGMQAAQVRGFETVISLDVFVGDEKIDVPLTVSLPYNLKPNENPAAVRVWHMDGNGNLTDLNGVFDPATGMVTFTINHQSYFIVGYDPVSLWVNIFSDVDMDAWYYEAVAYANYYALFSGYGDGVFAPQDSMTRAMFAQVLWNLEGKPLPAGVTSAEPWYHDAVLWAVESGITDGTSPTSPITRQEIAVMLMNYADFKGYDIPVNRDARNFNDKNLIASWAETAVKVMSEAGVFNGYDNNFNPTNTVTRAEVAQMFRNFMRFVVVANDGSIPQPVTAALSNTGTEEAYIDRSALEAIKRALQQTRK